MVWMFLFMGCQSEESDLSLLTCPEGFSEKPIRLMGVGKWYHVSKAKLVCWGKTPFSVVDQWGRVLLQDGLSIQQAAARIAHLELHIDNQPPIGEKCLEWWIHHEAEAMALELDLLYKWNVSTDHFGYSETYFGGESTTGVSRLETFIYNNPNGAKGMDGLVNGYQKRCNGKN